MEKHTFNYCATHKEDEAYMQRMCARGWAATRLVEGFWTFEPCAPNAYCYRICYLRGMKDSEVEALKQRLAKDGIQFVSRYSFWAIFRSPKEFRLYTPEEELAICRKMYAPMPVGAALSWVAFLAGIWLTAQFSLWFVILTALLGIYGTVCTWLGLSYHRLLKRFPAES